MPIAQSKRKLIAATALFIAVGALTGAIATQGAATVSFAQTDTTGGGGATTGGGGGATTGGGGGATAGGGERIVRQGTITSIQDPLPGHEGHQAAVILPLRQDGSVYSGVITYTASAPVEVVVPQVVSLNASQQAVLNGTDDAFGTLVTSPLDNQTSLAISIITPTYGDTPVPSASIPFTGNALWLHTLDGTPFVASYAVSAQVLPAQTENNVSTAPPTTAEEDGDDGDDEGGAAAAADGGGAAAADGDEEEDEGGAAAADGGGAAADEEEDEGGAAAGA